MKSNAAKVQKALAGIEYPKEKQEVVSYAKDHGASQDVVDDLQSLPDKRYKTAADLSSAFSGK
ncbi:DUF2795 domain-containing protein [Methanolobus halotolerans]|uniref:DUF2795 domain-containing protein n=1 Tax=Methanolobus halotolerans TaxID=2052935 RepID=A0A4E0PYV3_9EURY|nr:DUF2795 domain-containing protein [Methanolobus halotolerans]TGC10710.1 DUF2795 domain-containing protein [Methanolobus halotolerans]